MISPYKINFKVIIFLLTILLSVLVSGINTELFIGINSFAARSNPYIWSNLTLLGDTLPAAVMMLLFIRKRPDLIWAGIIATIIAIIVVNIIKFYAGSIRPPAVISKDIINIIGPALVHRSFPSGHTVTIFTLTSILIFYFRSVRVRLILILLALLVGISRIAVGVHWPVDVLAGAVLGSLFGIAGVYCVRKLEWDTNRKIQIIIGFVLICLSIYLLCFYDSKYPQAKYLQSILASAVLVAGIREYYLLLKETGRKTIQS